MNKGRIVEIDEDDFIDMLWGRVNTRYEDFYDDDVWASCFDFLSDTGWLEPQRNVPSYIVDNIAVNAEIVAKKDLPSEYGKSFEEMDEDEYLFDTPDYVVFNLGL